VPCLVQQLLVVERQLMYNSSKLFEKLKNLVPCLVLRLLVVERHLMHISNNCNRLIQKEKVWCPVLRRDSLLWSGT
jgi:hypothetical protein